MQTATHNTQPPSISQIMAIRAGKIGSAWDSRPRLGSAQANWSGCVLEHHLLPAGSLPANVLASHCFALPLGREPVDFVWRLNGLAIAGSMKPGHAYLRAEGDSLASEWSAPLDALFLSMEPGFIARAIGEEDIVEGEGRGQPRRLSLASDLTGRDDALLRHMTLALHASLAAPSRRNPLFEQWTLLAIASHLFAHYGGKTLPGAGIGALSPATLKRMQAFAQDELTAAVTLDDFAAIACLSPFQLCLAFRQATGTSIWQWLSQMSQRRAFEAAPTVAETDDPLCRLFQTTPAEAQAARQTLEGGSATEMAARLGISVSTFRSQLKAVYAKTDTHRSLDLLRLLIAMDRS